MTTQDRKPLTNPSRRIRLLAAAVVAIGMGGTLFEARIAERQRKELGNLRERHQSFSAKLLQLLHQNEASDRDLSAVQLEIASLEGHLGGSQTASSSSVEIETKAWLSRLQTARRIFADHPELAIPELRLLDQREWLRVTKDALFDTEEQVRKSLATVRDAAKQQFTMQLVFALRKYLAASGGQLPPTPQAVAAYFDPPIDPSIFDRYETLRTGKASDMSPSERMRAVIREKAPVDEDYDGRFGIDANAIQMGGGNNAQTWIADPDGYDGMIRRARAEFARANNGAKAAGLEQLAPYITPPLAPAKLEKLLRFERELAR